MYLTEDSVRTPITPDSIVGSEILNFEKSAQSVCVVETIEGYNSSYKSDSNYHLQSLLEQESLPHYQLSPDYLHSSIFIHPDSKNQAVSERCRLQTSEWMYGICDYFHLDREVVAVALFYVDRYFTLTSIRDPNSSIQNLGETIQQRTKQVPITRREFQLVSLTGLYLAIKLHGGIRESEPDSSEIQWNRLEFSVQVCASISRDQFSSEDIERCELSILRTLQWHMNPIVPSGVMIDHLIHFLPPVSVNGNANNILMRCIYDSSKYLTELSVSVPALCMVYKPSLIAYASVLYALDVFSSTQHRLRYESDIPSDLCQHFASEKQNIEKVRAILVVICPTLREQFQLTLFEPLSPTSVKV